MTISEYETLTGLTVSSSDEARYEAVIALTTTILADLLGYSFEIANEYSETGKTTSECPCPVDDLDGLRAPDAVVGSYRLYSYNKNDTFLSIDPATAVHKVKLVNNNVTYKTLDIEEYRLTYKRGLVKYLEQCCCWCACRQACSCVQLAVDATYLSAEPDDLALVHAEMVTHYADLKRDIKSQTLGSHSYTRFDNKAPQLLSHNIAIISRYVGPNGSLFRTITV